jgi:hypothetical protein
MQPLNKGDKFTQYRREHHKKLVDDKENRVQRDIIYEFDVWRKGCEESIKHTWIETFPWEKYESGVNNQCQWVRVDTRYFIDRQSFDVNKPRNINIYDLVALMVDSDLHKSKFTKFLERIFGGKRAIVEWGDDERARWKKLLETGDVAVEKVDKDA